MPSLHAHLRHLEPWYSEHLNPVHDVLYAGDLARGQAILDTARRALAESGLSPDERLTLDYEIAVTEMTALNRLGPPEEFPTVFGRTREFIQAHPPVGPLSDQAQALHLLRLLGAGYRRGFFSLEEDEVDALLARLSPEAYTNNLWYYLTAWAFHTGKLRFLEQAFGEQVVQTTGYLDDYFWLRTNLMYLLTAGRATKNDVLETIHRYPHPMYLSDFPNIFFPRLEQLGLLDAEVEGALEQRREELHDLDGQPPPQEPRTRRLLRN
jgi:hypothetical protein